MKVKFSKQAATEYRYWKKADKKVSARIDKLLLAIGEEPFSGIGKPEQLKHDLTGWWSRRITGEHRLVYRVEEGQLEVVQCRFHYR